MIAERDAKDAKTEASKAQRYIDKLWREERDIEYRKGVDARAAERTRKRILRERLANGMIVEDSDPLLVPIPDTEEIWWSQ